VSLLLGACKRDIENEDAVRRGILSYFAKRQDLSSMDVSVSKVAFRQNEADAVVHLQAKGTSAPGSGLDMSYVLERKGNEWVVKGKGLGPGHGGMGMPSPGQMPAPGQMPGSLPPGHPAVPPAGTPPPGQNE
jgi:hypothetical protein